MFHEYFTEFFISVGLNLASKVSPSNKNFALYTPHIPTVFAKNSVTEEEFKKAFFSLKPSKTAGYDNITSSRKLTEN